MITITALVPGMFFVAAYGFFKLKKWTPIIVLIIASSFLLFSIIILITLIIPGGLKSSLFFLFLSIFIYPVILFLIWWAVNKSKYIFTN